MNTKKRLIASLLAMAMCFTMLIGSTFAWFTDEAYVTGNKIQSGTLNIKLYEQIYEDTADEPTETEITDETEAIFDEAILWEPGYVKTLNLRFENTGSLAAEVKGMLVPVGEIGKLAEVIDVYVCVAPNGNSMLGIFPGRFAFNGMINSGTAEKVGTLKDVLENGLALNEVVLNANDSGYIFMALKMQETAGNEYQNEAAGAFDIRILAKQATVESDSFDNQYDKDASFATPVTTADELYTAINNGEPVVMMNDITINGGDSEYLGTSETEFISIDGNGHTLTFDNVHPNGTYTFTIIRTTNPDATLSISNAKITRTNKDVRHWTNNLTFSCNTTLSNVEVVDQSLTLDSRRKDKGFTYIFNNVNINDTRIADEHYAMFIVGGQTVNMNGCNISVAGDGDRAIKIVDESIYYKEATNLSISNTNFKSGKKAAVLVGSVYGANINLNNIDISNVKADTTNVVWVDGDYASSNDKVVVTGGTKIIEP